MLHFEKHNVLTLHFEKRNACMLRFEKRNVSTLGALKNTKRSCCVFYTANLRTMHN